jgi:hypothetical protein
MAPYPDWTLEESLAGIGLQRFVGPGRERPAQAGTAEAYESYEPAVHAPDAGDCRLKRSPIWATVSPSFGCAFVVVLRPVHATPASMPTTLCVPS